MGARIRQRPICVSGMVLAIISSLIAMTAAGKPLCTGIGRLGSSGLTTTLPMSTIAAFAVAAVVLVALITVAKRWAPVLASAVAFGLAGTEAIMVTIARTSSRFHPGTTTHLGSGGQILGIAFWVAVAGVIVLIIGARELLPDPDARITLDGAPHRSSQASTAVGASLLGVIFFPIAPVGVILGLIAYGQIIASNGRLLGRNLALTAILVGTAWISLWVIFVFATGIYSGSVA